MTHVRVTPVPGSFLDEHEIRLHNRPVGRVCTRVNRDVCPSKLEWQVEFTCRSLRIEDLHQIVAEIDRFVSETPVPSRENA
jgi:hypothetical protein